MRERIHFPRCVWTKGEVVKWVQDNLEPLENVFVPDLPLMKGQSFWSVLVRVDSDKEGVNCVRD